MSGDDDRPAEFGFRVPDELRVGVYANAARIWYSPYEFTLDWAVAEHLGPGDAEQEGDLAIVCARVRIPVGLIFEVLQAINRAMTFYERDHGDIRRNGE